MSRSDLNAIPRIIEACENDGDGAAGHGVRAAAAMVTINHLLGASQPREFVGRDGSDLVVPPLLLARLLRAARGEHVEVGRLVFLGKPTLQEQADDLAASARKLQDLVRAGGELRHQVQTQVETTQGIRHRIAGVAETLKGGDVDEAQVALAEILAGWEE